MGLPQPQLAVWPSTLPRFWPLESLAVVIMPEGDFSVARRSGEDRSPPSPPGSERPRLQPRLVSGVEEE